MTSQQYLETYLNDHRAGAAAGTALARRLWRKNRSGPWASHLHDILKSINAEKNTLDAVRAAVGVEGGQLRRAGALIVERASRLKTSNGLLRYSQLSRVLELEALMSGVQSKHRLWCALRLATPSFPELAPFDFSVLERSSLGQLELLGEIHEWAAMSCFERKSDH